MFPTQASQYSIGVLLTCLITSVVKPPLELLVLLEVLPDVEDETALSNFSLSNLTSFPPKTSYAFSAAASLAGARKKPSTSKN